MKILGAVAALVVAFVILVIGVRMVNEHHRALRAEERLEQRKRDFAAVQAGRMSHEEFQYIYYQGETDARDANRD